MAEIARWGDHYFKVEPTLIRSFSNMEIKASCETDDKTNSGEKYVARKNSKPTEVKLTIPLDARLGITDVKKEVCTFLSEAQEGKKGYFYAACKKLFTYQLMLVEAKVKNKDITPKGIWISADMELLLKQCTKIDGTIPKPKPSKPATSGDSGGTTGTEAAAGGTDHSHAEETRENIHSAAHSASSGKIGGSSGGGGSGRLVSVAMIR